MPQIKVENLYSTTITEAGGIPASGDCDFTVTTPPENTNGFIIISPENPISREIMYYHNVIGNRIYVRGVNRKFPKAHVATDIVKINDVAEIFNTFSDMISQAFYIEKTGGLGIKVWGGYVYYNGAAVAVPDTNLTLVNGTNYIKYDYPTNTVSSDLIASGNIKVEVTVLAGIITSIVYRNAKESFIDFTVALTGALPSQSGNAGKVLFTNGTTVYWGDIVIPNASTTVKGVSEQATKAEVISQSATGTTGAPIFIDPNTLISIDNYVAAEAIALGNAFTTESYYPAITCNSQITFGNAAATQQLAFRIIGNGISMSQVSLGLKNVGTPADNCLIEIHAETAGSPSGTALTSGLITGGAVTTTTTQYNISVSTITLTDRTPYWVVLRRSGSNDVANYYQSAVHTDDTIGFPYKINNAGAWGSNILTESLSIYGVGFYGNVAVMARATLQKFSTVLGFAPAAIAQYSMIGVSPLKVYGGLTALEGGKPYFLSNTPGAVSLTPGTFNSFIGFAINNTTIKIPYFAGFASPQRFSNTTNSLSPVYSTTVFSKNGGLIIFGASSTFDAYVNVETSVNGTSFTSQRGVAVGFPSSDSQAQEVAGSYQIPPGTFFRFGYYTGSGGVTMTGYYDFYENKYL